VAYIYSPSPLLSIVIDNSQIYFKYCFSALRVILKNRNYILITQKRCLNWNNFEVKKREKESFKAQLL
jgi:hypothetical protein